MQTTPANQKPAINMPDPQPEILAFIRNQFTGKHFPVADGQRFATMPDKATPMIGFKNLPKGMTIKRVEMTLNDLADTEYKEPWRFGGDNAITPLLPDDYLLAATAYTQSEGGKPCLSGKWRFSVGPAVVTPKPDPKPDPKPQPDPKPKPPDGIETKVLRKMICGGTSLRESVLKPIFAEQDFDGFRTWENFEWGQKWDSTKFDKLRRHRSLGRRIVALFHVDHIGESDAKMRDTFKAMMDATGGAVDGYEILNEPNLKNYFPSGSLANAMRIQQIAHEVISAAGRVHYGFAISTDINAVKAVDRVGYFGTCHVATFHPYQNERIGAIAVTKQYIEIVNQRRPISLTEWGLHGRWTKPPQNDEQWADNYQPIVTAIEDDVHEICIYRMEQNGQPAGHGGIIKPVDPANPDVFVRTAFYEPVRLLRAKWAA